MELQGVQDNTTACTPISAAKLKGLLKHGAVSRCIQMISPAISSQQSLSHGSLTSSKELPEEIS